MKIIVIGPSGAGKSEYSRKLQKIFNVELFHLDNIWWNSDKTHITIDEFDVKLDGILKKKDWIIDGDYSSTYERRMEESDCIFFLKYPIEVCLEGAKSRVGKKRTDLPWVEDTFDLEFKEWIENWYDSNLDRLNALLDKFKETKKVYIFTSRDEANHFLLEDVFLLKEELLKNDINKMNHTLTSFWNNAIKLEDSEKEEYLSDSNRSVFDIVPSKKLYDAVMLLKDKENVLDYGAGSGWASISLALNGAKNITAVDLGDNIINSILFYEKAYNARGIHAYKIDENWLKTVPSKSYDGIICSNVLDVFPEETKDSIIKEFARLLKRDSLLIVGLNYYISKEQAEESKLDFIKDKYLFVDGILRLASYSDSAWESFFLPYFEIVFLDHFKWEGENTEKRRLFVLKRRENEI
jgi:adenylate kinase family enzyme/SAM-dependent methyltransferase